MIIYSLNDAAKFLNCAKKTVQRMVENGEMPKPLREETDAGGKIRRIWDSEQLTEIKNTVLARRKHRPRGPNVSTKEDKTTESKAAKKP